MAGSLSALFRRRGWVTGLGMVGTVVFALAADFAAPHPAARVFVLLYMAGWYGPLLLWQWGIVRHIPGADPATDRRAVWLRRAALGMMGMIGLLAALVPLDGGDLSGMQAGLFAAVAFGALICMVALLWSNAKALARPLPEQGVPRGDPAAWFFGLLYFPLCIPHLNRRFRLAAQA